MITTPVVFDHITTRKLVDSPDFTAGEVRLLKAVVDSTDNPTYRVWASQALLAHKAGLSRQTVNGMLRRKLRHLFTEQKVGRQVRLYWRLCDHGAPLSICRVCSARPTLNDLKMTHHAMPTEQNPTPSLRVLKDPVGPCEKEGLTDGVRFEQPYVNQSQQESCSREPGTGVLLAVRAESPESSPDVEEHPHAHPHIQSVDPKQPPAVSAYDRVTDLLCNVRRNGTSFLASCPVESHGRGNGDRNPSLSVTEKDGRVLLHCMSGCLVDEVMASIGLDFPDLWDEPLVKETKVSEYVYLNRSGDPYFVAERWQSSTGKRFVQRLPDKEKPGLGGLQTTLYQLPRVLAAAAANQPIWVVEGEKCVHAIETLGVVATTSPGGAANWQDLFTDRLIGASVVNIVADNDVAGLKHAAMVMASCKQKGLPVKVWQAAVPGDKADIYDHVIAGKKISDLIPLRLNQTKPEGITPQVLMATDYPPVTWVIPGLLPTGTAVLAGEPKAGKSLMSLDWGIGVASGRDTMHQVDTIPGSVLYLSLDNDSPRRLQRRYASMAQGYRRDLPIEFHTTWPTATEAIAAVVEWAEIETDEGRVPRLVVADTLTMIEPGWENGPGGQTGYSHTVKVMRRWNQLAEDLDIAIVFVHHTRKSQQKEGGNWKERILGSQGLPATINTIVMIDTDAENKGLLHIAGRDVGSQDLRIERDGLFWNCIERPFVDRPRFTLVPNLKED